eukprot:3705881-Alexandrium_andersonii.AAC.1
MARARGQGRPRAVHLRAHGSLAKPEGRGSQPPPRRDARTRRPTQRRKAGGSGGRVQQAGAHKRAEEHAH